MCTLAAAVSTMYDVEVDTFFSQSFPPLFQSLVSSAFDAQFCVFLGGALSAVLMNLSFLYIVV